MTEAELTGSTMAATADAVPSALDIKDCMDRLRYLLAGLRLTCMGARDGLSHEEWNGLIWVASHAEELAEEVRQDMAVYRASLAISA